MKNEVMLFGTKCTLKFGYYDNKTVAITAIRISDRERFYVATVNYEEHFQGKSYKKQLGFPKVVIKNYSENEGIYQQLIDAGVITNGPYLSGSGATVQSGCLTDEWQMIAKTHLAKIK
jgi:hypothetical protein